MKGQINTSGQLSIERSGKMLKQECPYYTDRYCGHWCPLFGEPDRFPACNDKITGSLYPERITLDICENRTLVFIEFVDERRS
jgi:hypothetical protein